MTKTTILNAIANYISENGPDTIFATDGDKTITGADVMDFITKERATLAKRNETAKKRNAAKKADADKVIMDAITSALENAESPMGTDALATAVSDIVGKTITWQKAVRVANTMENVVKAKIKVDKKAKTVYALKNMDEVEAPTMEEIC